MVPREPDPARSLDPLGGGGLRHNPFAALRPKGSEPAETPAPAPQADAEPDSDPTADKGLGRLVVALERKGHGGKSVVRVQGLATGAEAKQLARQLGRALGRGARADGLDVVVQGADLDGPIEWLRGQGAERIIRGTP